MAIVIQNSFHEDIIEKSGNIQPDRQEWITSGECIYADSSFVLPLIFWADIFLADWVSNDIYGELAIQLLREWEKRNGQWRKLIKDTTVILLARSLLR